MFCSVCSTLREEVYQGLVRPINEEEFTICYDCLNTFLLPSKPLKVPKKYARRRSSPLHEPKIEELQGNPWNLKRKISKVTSRARKFLTRK